MTPIDELFTQIGKFVLKQTDCTFLHAQSIIKQHTEKLSQIGDIGFPTTIQPWLNLMENSGKLNDTKQIIGENEDEFAKKLIETSSNWMFPIQMVHFKQFRCLLFLDREKCYNGVLKTVLYDDASYGQWHHTNDAKKIYAVQLANQSDDHSLVEHRCMLIAKILTNLLDFSGFQTLSKSNENLYDTKNLVQIIVSRVRRDVAKRVGRQNQIEFNNNANSNTETKPIVCGNVNCRSGITADDLIRLRSLEMKKMAESKHGNHKENGMLDKCHKLGTAIVTFDLLKIKHFNAIDSEKLMGATTANKGAAFILYNVARLQTLLATFDHQVANGFYNALPDFDQIDFGLLKEEEEWQMCYAYIVGFPTMLERCVSGMENGQISIHLLCTFLSNLSAIFSAYYHRVKILTDNLPQLLPVMYARIYFLRALRAIFLKSLTILEIEPLDQM